MAKTTRAYFIPVTIAAALGYTAGFASDGLSEANAVEVQRNAVVCSSIAPEQTATVETFLGNILCDDIKSEFGIDACPANAIRQRGVRFKWDEESGDISACTNIRRVGNWIDSEE
jgi:hypothetical protein